MIEVRNFSKEIKGKLILDHVNCSFEFYPLKVAF